VIERKNAPTLLPSHRRPHGGKEDSVMETGRTVSVEAMPAPLNIDLAKTAVLVIDMQNDFGSKGGMFDRAGIDVSVIQRAV
jgi:hypothetical protein